LAYYVDLLYSCFGYYLNYGETLKPCWDILAE
jgi:hypothetical protein